MIWSNWSYPRWLACTAAVLAAAVAGCVRCCKYGTGHDFYPVPPSKSEVTLSNQIVPIPPSSPYSPLESYPLRVGDQIQFTLSVDPKAQAGVYRIGVNDQLVIEYLHEPGPDNRARTMRVLPNGTIDLPLIGPVAVADKTVDEVKNELNRLASKYFTHPQIAVTVSEHSAPAEELRKTFSSGFTNQSLTVVVNPDGTINLPEIGTLYVFGRTLPELRDEANRLYNERVPGVRVWPHLTQRAPDHVYVLGEVRKPDRYLLDRPTHVSQVVAQAGGWNLGAQLHEVVLVRYREGSPEAVLLDLHHAVRQDHRPRCVDLTDDILVADGDIIYLPKDHVQNVNDVIRRVFAEGAYGVLPIPQVYGR